MKTICGEVTSTKPASLSQAARTISTFLSVDNGGSTSQAVTAYLKRTSVAFNELVQFHKDQKAPKFKAKKSRPVDPLNSGQMRLEYLENGVESKKNRQSPGIIEQKGTEVQGKSGKEERAEGDSERKEKRKKKGSEGSFGTKKNVEEGEGRREVSVGDGQGQKEKKFEANSGDAVEVSFERKREKIKNAEREIDGDLGIEEERKKKMIMKKMKEVNRKSLEQIGLKKKRRVGGDD